MIELKKSVNAHVKTEMAFLRTQIKPHFLYNTLSVIASLITRRPEKAKEYLLDLSDFLRESFNFDSNNEMIPLKEELNITKKYLNLEKERFKERLSFVFDIDDEIYIDIPMLIIL